MDAAVTLNPADDGTNFPNSAFDFSSFYNGGTAKFLFDPAFTLKANTDGILTGNGTVTLTLTPNAVVPEPASVVSLLTSVGVIGAWMAARRVRSYFRPAALSS